MEINVARTLQLKNEQKYKDYVKWLEDSGCIFPNVMVI